MPSGVTMMLRRLEIAMDDALFVRRLERVATLAPGAAFPRTEAGDTPLGEHLGERLAFDQLHHQIIRADVVKRADVGMIQGGDGARFALETLAEWDRWRP